MRPALPESTGTTPLFLTTKIFRSPGSPAEAQRKIVLFCNLRPERVIPALDADTIYQVPVAYHGQGFNIEVCRHFGLEAKEPNLSGWHHIDRKSTRLNSSH